MAGSVRIVAQASSSDGLSTVALMSPTMSSSRLIRNRMASSRASLDGYIPFSFYLPRPHDLARDPGLVWTDVVCRDVRGLGCRCLGWGSEPDSVGVGGGSELGVLVFEQGVLVFELGVVVFELGVLVLQVEDHADAGEVESGVEEVADAAEPVEVVGAVPAGAAVGAVGLEQPARFVQAQVLDAHPDQVGGHGYAVYATARVQPWVLHHPRSLRPRVRFDFSRTLLLHSACHRCYIKSTAHVTDRS